MRKRHHGIAVERNWGRVFWINNPSRFGALSVRLQFSSIGYWSHLHITRPWFIFWSTSSTAWFSQTKCPPLQVNEKKTTQMYLSRMPVRRHWAAKKEVGKSRWKGLLHDCCNIYIRVSSINAEPSPTASSKTHPDTGWPSSYGNS